MSLYTQDGSMYDSHQLEKVLIQFYLKTHEYYVHKCIYSTEM